MRSLISLLRISQWIKNSFIFLPLFFGGGGVSGIELRIPPLIIAFFAFSFAASGIYCLNDILDRNVDRMHPVKKFRPVASGKVPVNYAITLTVICFIISALLCILPPLGSHTPQIFTIVGIYIVMNLAYCFYLKNIAILDVFIIATGFVLRVLVGGCAADIELSHWIVLMTFLLALFLAFAKRRDDVMIYETTGNAPRKNITNYNIAFINQLTTILATITIVCYIMYSVSPELMHRLGSRYIYLTTIFVIAGIIRYLQITTVKTSSGSPTKVLMHDMFLQLCIIGWLVSFFSIIYL